MKSSDEQKINEFLREMYHTNLEEMLRPENKGTTQYFQIMNHLYKAFTGHWIEGGVLVGEEDKPNPQLRFYYHNFHNFNHIETPKELIYDLKRLIVEKPKRLKDMRDRLEQLGQQRSQNNHNPEIER